MGHSGHSSIGNVSPWEMVNDADKAEAIRLLAQGYSLKRAAILVGRTLPQLHSWIQADAGFRAAMLALNNERDHEVIEFRERVRLAAGTMLDHLMSLADGAKQEQVRRQSVETFFREIHNPIYAPRAQTSPAAPAVFVNAAQAAILFPAAPAPAPAPADGAADGSSARRQSDPPTNGGATFSPLGPLAPSEPSPPPSSSVLSFPAPLGFQEKGHDPGGAQINETVSSGDNGGGGTAPGRSEGDTAQAAPAAAEGASQGEPEVGVQPAVAAGAGRVRRLGRVRTNG